MTVFFSSVIDYKIVRKITAVNFYITKFLRIKIGEEKGILFLFKVSR